MNLMIVGAPTFAILSTVLLALIGVSWWVLLASLFLSAPAFIAIAFVLCKTVLPCDRFSGQSDNWN